MTKWFFTVILILSWLPGARAGAVNGPLMSQSNLVLPGNTNFFWGVVFHPNEPAEVYLTGEGFKEMTLEIYDAHNKLVATGEHWKNEGPKMDWYRVAWMVPGPGFTYFRIIVRNNRVVPNDVIIGVR